jgi:micrococcal nuclease
MQRLFFYIATVVVLAASVIVSVENGEVAGLFTTRTGDQTADTQSALFVSYVEDGDTVVLGSGERVRYLGINTPESGESYADQATQRNMSLVQGKTVTLTTESETRDMYGRLLAYVQVDGVSVQELLLSEGLATAYFLQKSQNKEKYNALEEQARISCKGMWEGLCTPQARCIKVASIRSDPPGNNAERLNDEWVDIINVCKETIDITGWLLRDASSSNRYTFTPTLLAPSATVRVHSGCGKDSGASRYWSCPAKKAGIWNNDHDILLLFDRHGAMMEWYSY